MPLSLFCLFCFAFVLITLLFCSVISLISFTLSMYDIELMSRNQKCELNQRKVQRLSSLLVLSPSNAPGDQTDKKKV